MSASFELSDVERVAVGTVGVPGQRTFYLQARQGRQLVTLKLEKQQVAALVQLMAELLSDLPATDAALRDRPADLEEPVLAEWPVGAIQLAYDGTGDRVIILAEEVDAGEEEQRDDDDSGVARLSITREQAASLITRGGELVSSGRPACPLCGNPMDPEGHSCPKTNGHGPKH